MTNYILIALLLIGTVACDEDDRAIHNQDAACLNGQTWNYDEQQCKAPPVPQECPEGQQWYHFEDGSAACKDEGAFPD